LSSLVRAATNSSFSTSTSRYYGFAFVYFEPCGVHYAIEKLSGKEAFAMGSSDHLVV
jgi:hypothetical protein